LLRSDAGSVRSAWIFYAALRIYACVRLDKSTLRRGWLLVLLVMAVFIALTKIFPSEPTSPTVASQSSDVAKPSH
jgi:hypothetical protein